MYWHYAAALGIEKKNKMENCEKKLPGLTSSHMCVISLPGSSGFSTLPLSGAIISYSETRPWVFQYDIYRESFALGLERGGTHLFLRRNFSSYRDLLSRGSLQEIQPSSSNSLIKCKYSLFHLTLTSL